MARTSDPHSASSQFFIDVVDKIAKVKTTIKPPYRDVPVEPAIIIKAEIVNK